MREYRDLKRSAALQATPWPAVAEALRVTAREIRATPTARAALLKGLRSALAAPASPAASASTSEAEGFLAFLDSLAVVRRADVVKAYVDAGSPGDLDDARLRALAAERWGEARKLKGHYVYRPSAKEAR